MIYDTLLAIGIYTHLFVLHPEMKLRYDQYEDDTLPSIVGSYSSTKCDWMNWIVSADLPTPVE